MERGNGQELKALVVSVPLRIDIGGTWDLKAFALLFEHISPSTVNIAIDLPTTLTFRKRDDDLIAIQDDYCKISTDLETLDFRSGFGLLLAICSHYQFRGFSVDIAYSVPPGNGLGGSGALSAGFLYGLLKLFRGGVPNLRDIAKMVHDIEEGLRFSYCGLQDQCASLYGGVSKWTWQYSKPEPFIRQPLIDTDSYAEISKRLVIAYLGHPHGANINQRQIDSLYDLHTRRKWFCINEITELATEAILNQDWFALQKHIDAENSIRLKLVPGRATRESRELEEAAAQRGIGFGIAGAGAGGCVFAFAPDPSLLDDLLSEWARILNHKQNAEIYSQPAISKGLKWTQEC